MEIFVVNVRILSSNLIYRTVYKGTITCVNDSYYNKRNNNDLKTNRKDNRVFDRRLSKFGILPNKINKTR